MMRAKYAKTIPTSCAGEAKKRQNAGSANLLYGLIVGVTRFKGKGYREGGNNRG